MSNMRDNPFLNNPDGAKPPETQGYYAPPPSPSQPVQPATPSPASSAMPAASASTPVQASSTVPSSKATAAPVLNVAKPDSSLASVVDTIEAIIIALILALVFRAFVVEAFVIPTGSMAPTLLGAHFKVACPKCGVDFDRDVKLEEQLSGDSVGPQRLSDGTPIRELINAQTLPIDPVVFCPNCGYAISGGELPENPPKRYVNDNRTEYSTGQKRDVYFPWAHNGDRILVLKYLYAIAEPQRWDVIVFKEPMLAKDNYIKRLIGLPGETIQIIDGDIYVGTDDGSGGVAPPEKRFIARKPNHIQDALWQLVYDNDHYPVDAGKPRNKQEAWRTPWRATAGSWHVDGPVIEFSGNTADRPGRLEFFPEGFYTRNILGYNNDATRTDLRYYCSDLRLTAAWAPADGPNAQLSMVLGKPNNRFRTTIQNGKITLSKFDPEQKKFDDVTPAWVKPQAIEKDRVYTIAMTNVDRMVQLFVNGSQVLEYSTTWTARDAEMDQDKALKADIRIEAFGACKLSHVKLERDLYYTQYADPSNPPSTASDKEPLLLGKDEFFALGDNSARSHDGRTWNHVHPSLDDLGLRPGVVPRRFLLGKAFFVYWPAGNRPLPDSIGRGTPPLLNPPLVPDAGNMRFIK